MFSDVLLCIVFNVELSIIVPLPAPSETLRVGTWRSIFSSAFHFSWARMVVVWMNCNVHFCVNSMSSCPLYVFQFPAPFEELRVGTWRNIFSAFHFSWPRVVLVWLSYSVRFCVFSESVCDVHRFKKNNQVNSFSS